MAGSVADWLALCNRPDAMNELYAQYAHLTPADLQRVASTYFSSHNRSEVTLTSEAAK